MWAVYVPHFDAAVELWRYYRGLEGRPFELVIHAQHNSEYQHWKPSVILMARMENENLARICNRFFRRWKTVDA